VNGRIDVSDHHIVMILIIEVPQKLLYRNRSYVKMKRISLSQRILKYSIGNMKEMRTCTICNDD
jgi:hypothetical protein